MADDRVFTRYGHLSYNEFNRTLQQSLPYISRSLILEANDSNWQEEEGLFHYSINFLDNIIIDNYLIGNYYITYCDIDVRMLDAETFENIIFSYKLVDVDGVQKLIITVDEKLDYKLIVNLYDRVFY